MIKIKDLRVDNYVYENYGGYYKVVNIQSVNNNKNVPYVDLKKEGGLIGRYDLSSVCPIPIDKDVILKNAGFNEDYDKGWIGIDVKHEGGTTTDFILATPFNMGEWQDFYAFVYDKQELKVNF